MRNLVAYSERTGEFFDAIASSKNEPRRSLLLGLDLIIRRRYRQYDLAKGDLGRLGPSGLLSASEREALLHCYEGSTAALEELKRTIRGVQPEPLQWRCQYCTFGQSSTWDHYLPKEHFPEFSVYAPNLVPLCHDCNERRTPWLRENQRTTLHLYYDPFDWRECLIDAELGLEDDGPKVSFTLAKSELLATSFGALFARHVAKLGLFRRFEREALARLETIGVDIQRCAKRLTIAEIASELGARAGELAKTFGANHIEAILYRAAAASAAIIEYYVKPKAG